MSIARSAGMGGKPAIAALRGYRRGLFALAACLLARAVIPVGYMPGDVLAGELMVLCPTSSAATYALLQERHHRHDHHDTGSHHAGVSLDSGCPIGSALSAAAIPAELPGGVTVPRFAGYARAPAPAPRTSRVSDCYQSRAPPRT